MQLLFGCLARIGTGYWYWILQVVVLVLQRSTLLSRLGQLMGWLLSWAKVLTQPLPKMAFYL